MCGKITITNVSAVDYKLALVLFRTTGHFYLTNLLLDKLKASVPSRIVTVSSMMHEWHALDFDDLQFERNWSHYKAYGRSKTANILFSVHLAKLLKGERCRGNS
jgi:NAD(P)-dependent dehydrogenase (short-subunit alcohol dehydrogenase family)